MRPGRSCWACVVGPLPNPSRQGRDLRWRCGEAWAELRGLLFKPSCKGRGLEWNKRLAGLRAVGGFQADSAPPPCPISPWEGLRAEQAAGRSSSSLLGFKRKAGASSRIPAARGRGLGLVQARSPSLGGRG